MKNFDLQTSDATLHEFFTINSFLRSLLVRLRAIKKPFYSNVTILLVGLCLVSYKEYVHCKILTNFDTGASAI